MNLLKLAAIVGMFLTLSISAECQQKSSASATIVITAIIERQTAFDLDAAQPKSSKSVTLATALTAHRTPGYEIQVASPNSRLVRTERELSDCSGSRKSEKCRLMTLTITPRDF